MLSCSHFPFSVMLLQKQYKLLQLKRLLHGYGVRDFNFSNASKGLVCKDILIPLSSNYHTSRTLLYFQYELFDIMVFMDPPFSLQLYIRCILTHDGPKILEDALQVCIGVAIIDNVFLETNSLEDISYIIVLGYCWHSGDSLNNKDIATAHYYHCSVM